MQIFSILLFGLSSNIDNLFIGMAYGAKKIKIGMISNLIIGSITFIGTLVSMFLGKTLLYFIPLSIASALGSIIIIAIGCFYLIKYLYYNIKKISGDLQIEKYDKDKSGNIELSEAFALGFALTINNIGLGIGASIIGLNIIATAIVSFLISVVFIHTSNLVGNNYVSKFLGKYTELIGSVMIILLGVCEFIL
ncbi:MAG: manganese efflux pump [Oscillospiraceae bacterium]|nr:manganese efflux pump [Oscillospiraceae bacterium]